MSGAAAGRGAVHPVGPATRVELPPLTVVEDGEEYVVGDPETGTFVTLPEIGLITLRQLGAGSSVGDTTVSLLADHGVEVDVADFVETMAACGLLLAIDGVRVREAPPRASGWLRTLRPGLVRPLFGPVAWVLYAAALAWVVVVVLLRPDERPSFEDLIFYPDPAVSLVCVMAVATALTGGHELFHFIAARAEGVGATFAVSRRAFLPVFETDLSQLWSVERRRRYGPLLAGMAFDVLVLAVCLGLRMLVPDGSGLLGRFLAAVILVRVVALLFQCMVFLRTDLYLVLLTALGARDLRGTVRLFVKSRLFRLRPDERAALERAHPRDRQLAPWFGMLQLVGLGLLGFTLVTYWLPATAMMAGWILMSLGGASPAAPAFWEALLLALALVLPALVTAAVMLRERLLATPGRTGR